MYFGVLAVGIIGAIFARLQPPGMAVTLAQAMVAAIALTLRLGLPWSRAVRDPVVEWVLCGFVCRIGVVVSLCGASDIRTGWRLTKRAYETGDSSLFSSILPAMYYLCSQTWAVSPPLLGSTIGQPALLSFMHYYWGKVL
jgi:hypothetical protein